MGEIRSAIAAADPDEIARASEAGEMISVGSFMLEPDEVLVERVALKDYAVATEAGYAGAVLTIVSDELKAEGMAREVVRVIQNLRKSSGLEISDRINLWISSSAEIEQSLIVHSEYISEETLTESVEFGAAISDDSLASAAIETLDLDDARVTIMLEKA